MTFELSSEQVAVRDRARDFAADQLSDVAASVDRNAAVPASIAREASALVTGDDATAYVAAVEELAAVSATVGAAAALGSKSSHPSLGLSGLRGLTVGERASERARLGLAAVALGIGRAALDHALEELRTATPTGKSEEKPHWVLADAATELEAARLVTLQAAQALSGDEAVGRVALARLMASGAAARAVDAALRIAGAEGLREGTLLERLSRDARAVSLVLGTEEDHRAAAAQGLFDQ